MEAFVEIIHPDGRADRHPLQGDRLTLGASAQADLPVLDAEELEPLHLLLAPRSEGCWVSAAREARTPVLVGGASFDHGLLEWGSEIDIGSLTFRVGHPGLDKNRSGTVKVLVLLALALMAGWAVLGALMTPEEGLPQTTAQPPALFAEEARGCPEQGSAAARLAQDTLEAARARAERYPFDPREGVKAVRLFGHTTNCLSAAGEEEKLAEVERERRRMREQVEEDYRLHALRIQRALEVGRIGRALVQARILLAYLHGTSSRYRDWLVQLERILDHEVQKALEEKEEKEASL